MPQRPTYSDPREPVPTVGWQLTAPLSEIYLVGGDAPCSLLLTAALGGAGFASRSYAAALDFLMDCDHLPPGCVIAELGSIGMDVVEFVRRLQSANVAYPIIIVAGGRGDVLQAVQAMQAGAVDFIQRPFTDLLLLGAVRRALTLAALLSPHAASRQLRMAALAALTPRERQVLDGVIEGKPNKVIARECGISPRTVEIYRASVMRKSGARSVSALVRLALLTDQADPAGAQVA